MRKTLVGPILLVLALAFITLTQITGRPVQADGLFDYLTGGSRSLSDVEADIHNRFPEIEHVTPESLATAADNDPPVLIDVRQADEYAVSRLNGAIRINPDASPQQVAAQINDHIAGRRVVFYCSVGERSSRMAKRVKTQLIAAGAKSVQNLKGGIFAWHNRQNPLVDDDNQPTPYVHPYDTQWGKLVARQSLIRYKPNANRTD